MRKCLCISHDNVELPYFIIGTVYEYEILNCFDRPIYRIINEPNRPFPLYKEYFDKRFIDLREHKLKRILK